MANQANTQKVDELKEMFSQANCALFAKFSGVKAEDMTALRKELRATNSSLKVVKNTLAKIAIKDTQYAETDKFFTGPVSVTFSNGEDVSEPARKLIDFAKKNDSLEIIGGALEGSVLDAGGVKKLADMPPKPVIQSMLLGVLQAPARNMLGVMEGVGRKFLYALSAIAEKKKEEGQG